MSWAHLLGTDSLGRDVLSRLLVGARSVIAVPLLATLLAFAVGGVLGMFAGYRGGHTDAAISRGLEIALSLAPLLIVAVIITAAGTSTLVLVVSVAAVFAPRIARVLRGATQTVAVNDYVQAALARGERDLSIILREILPNIAPTVFVEFAVRLTYAIIFVATLNFLGLGLQPPSPNWGVMVAESRTTVTVAPLTTLAPALAIGLVCDRHQHDRRRHDTGARLRRDARPELMSTSLSINNLTIGYRATAKAPPTVVVRGVDLALEPGRILGLAGESGCGKSTTALAAIGYPIPGSVRLSGTAFLGDTDLLSVPRRELRRIWGSRISYVAQDAALALNPVKRVSWLIAEPMSIHLGIGGAEVHSRSLALLESVGIRDAG